MANGERGAPTVAVRTLSRFERLPLRRIVLLGLTVAIVLVVGGGIAKTLTLPALAILFASAIAVSVGVAVLLERVAYRRLRNAPRLVPLITAIGASLFLQNTFQGLFGAEPRGYPRPSLLTGTVTTGSVSFDKMDPIVFITALVMMLALQFFVKRTKTGKSMRAVAED